MGTQSIEEPSGPAGPAGEQGPTGPAASQTLPFIVEVASELALDIYVPIVLPGGCTVTGFSAAASFEIVGTNLTVSLAQPSDGPVVTLTVGTGSYVTVAASEALPWVFPFGPAPTVTTLRLRGGTEITGYIAGLITYTPAD